MTSPAALYRRYRPDAFQDVIGQEHVTEPLMMALRKNRVNHAYLFSGPRGCGKTTSARILARCLNCEKGPTDTPCGVCPSCVELARGGSGSLDVIEIDAASHGGVDDARDLRERATFAPVRDRYKIFIIDEAHMVTSAGFNALLKIVEEPPEHIKFIFATTEPDKVIGTIRSRTHHYPFRLVPPEPLLGYLDHLCTTEEVSVAPGVLSLVVRAGGGSVRDSLSVLDQLMAGAGPQGLDYELAVSLLGYTHASLLDDVVDAIAAGDSGTVFRGVDRVIQTGHDPRRFVEDLLERLRDLIVVQALPDAAEAILRGVPEDQLARLRAQAQSLGPAELSRAADVSNEALNEMTGATSPRLHLELLCARLMLPSAESGERGWAARLDRVERRLSYSGEPVSAPASASPVSPVPPSPSGKAQGPTQSVPPSAAETDPPLRPQPVPAAPIAAPQRSAVVEPAPERGIPAPKTPAPAPDSGEPAASAEPPRESATPRAGGSVEMFRRAWPEILDALAKLKRSSWALVGPNATVAGFDGQTVALAFGTSGLAAAFTRGEHSENLRRSIKEVLGVDCQIDAVTGGNGPSTAPTVPERSAEPGPKAPADPLPGTSTPMADLPSRPTEDSLPNPTEDRLPEDPAGLAVAASVPAQPAPVTTAVPVQPSEADVAWGLAPATDSPAPVPASATIRNPGSAPSDDAPPPEDFPPYGEEPPAEGEEPAPEDDQHWAPRPERGPEPPEDSNPQQVGGQRQDRGHETSRPPASPARGTASEGTRGPAEDDPWTRAKESAPGIWSLGTASNLGSFHPAAAVGETLNATAAGPQTVEPQAAGRQSAEHHAPAPTPDLAPAPAYAPAAAQPPGTTSSASPARPSEPASADSRKLSMYERLSRNAVLEREEQSPREIPALPSEVEDVPSADDETIEDSQLFGRAAVERILGGKLIEERGLDGSPLPPR